MFSYQTEELRTKSYLPENRIGIYLDELLFPSALRPEVEAKRIHPSFEKLGKGFHSHLGKKFALSNPNTHGTVMDLFQADYEGLLLVDKLNSALPDFGKRILRANIAVVTDGPSRRDRLRIIDDRVGVLARDFPVLKLPETNIRRCELAIQDPAQILQIFRDRQRIMTDAYILNVASLLDYLVEKQVVGLIQWFGPKICRANFFRTEIVQKQTDFQQETQRATQTTQNGNKTTNRHTDTTTTEKEFERVAHWERHEHDLIGANELPLPADEVPKPSRVHEFLESGPERWIHKMLRVVDGQVIHEKIVSAEVSRHNWVETDVKVEKSQDVYYRDPFIVLHPYVLMGWNISEVQ